MRYPKFLSAKGCIGYTAPSFACVLPEYRIPFEAGVEFMKKNGHAVAFTSDCFNDYGVGISSEPEVCAEQLVESYVNDTIDVIITCGGGELMCETLPYIDFEILKKAEPKWVMGYSDITNITFLLTTICDVASIYGPCANAFGRQPMHESVRQAYDMLRGECLSVHSFDKYEKESLKDAENPLVSYNLTEEVIIRGFIPSEGMNDRNNVMLTSEKKILDNVMLTDRIDLKGRLIGGCLDILLLYLGTKYDYVNQFSERYKEDGIIWYLEACDLNVFSIRRALWQLKEAGWFKYVKGFIFGRPRVGEDIPEMNIDHFSAVLKTTCVELGVPVIMDADIGHLPPSMPLINGALAQVKFESGKLDINFELK